MFLNPFNYGTTTIKSYDINSVLSNRLVNIIRGVTFIISWSVSSSIHNISLYLSNDAIFSYFNDERILSINCGDNSLFNESGFYVNTDCTLGSKNTSLEISCLIGQGTRPVDISNIAAALPYTGYIIAKVCNDIRTSCALEAVAVKLQNW